ncbi:rhodanese-like domain-containing protein [Bacillus marinisedimentorum]|uniref:rhodanese-like domain-containing protein n=1 Tax=Bacillus marinisedimentorum TaxID=1821260 RepID=UPI000872505F|nr:rhodanese-like domain-containing protein [Bacillus marinisedimentorum]
MWWKKSKALLMMLVLSLSLTGFLTACSGDEEAEAPADDTAAAEESAENTEATAEPVVDETAIIAEAAEAYFNNLPENVNMIDVEKMNEQVSLAADQLFILDIRSPEDFTKGHINGAVNIPFAQVGQKMAEIPKDKQVAVVCYSGQTASQTAAVLKMAGFNTIILKGGFPAWEKGGFDISTL